MFTNFKTCFLLLAEAASIPMASRRLDLYDKLTVDLQTALVPVLSTLTTFNTLSTCAIEVDQERKWISQRVLRARAVARNYGQTQLLTDAPKAQAPNYGSVNNNTPAFKVRSISPAPRVHFADSKPRSPTPPPDSRVTCYNCGQTEYYALVCTSPQKPSADLQELERAIEQDFTVNNLNKQGKDKL